MKHRYLKIAVLPLVVIVLVVFGLGYWRFVTIGQNQKLINEAKIVKAVGNLVVLPIGETPVIAEVNDVGQLKDQLFYV